MFERLHDGSLYYPMAGEITEIQNRWIGAGALIMPGVTVGEGGVIDAGSVVTHDIPANVAAADYPAGIFRGLRAYILLYLAL